MDLLLVAASLHLGLESLIALGQAADVGVSCLVVLHLSLVDLLVVLLDVGQEPAGAEEPPVLASLLAGAAGVLLLLRPDPDLPPVDRGEMVVEVVLPGEGGGTLRAVQPNLLVHGLHVAGEVVLVSESQPAGTTLKALPPLVNGGHVPGQDKLPIEGQAAARLGADKGRAAVD